MASRLAWGGASAGRFRGAGLLAVAADFPLIGGVAERLRGLLAACSGQGCLSRKRRTQYWGAARFDRPIKPLFAGCGQLAAAAPPPVFGGVMYVGTFPPHSPRGARGRVRAGPTAQESSQGPKKTARAWSRLIRSGLI